MVHGVYRRGKKTGHQAGFFLVRSDTHESVENREDAHRTKESDRPGNRKSVKGRSRA